MTARSRVPDLADRRPANTNVSPFVETWPIGDPRTFARVLARILVRRALLDAGVIPDDDRCENQGLAG